MPRIAPLLLAPLLLAGLLVACRKEVVHPARPDAATAVVVTPDAEAAPVITADAVGPTGSPAPDAGAGPGDPYAELGDLDKDYAVLGDRVFGFSADDRYLASAVSVCDPCPMSFRFEGPGVAPIELSYYYDPRYDGEDAEKRRAAQDAKVDRRLASLGAVPAKEGRRLRGPFPYPDLVFAERSVKDAEGAVTLLVGAHVPGGEPVFPLRIPLGGHPTLAAIAKERLPKIPPADRPAELASLRESFGMHDARLAYVNVSRNGRELGAVAFVRGDGWYEGAAVGRMPAASFAAQVYNDTGMKKLEAGDAAAAAELFAKAEAARPDQALFAYNLACAAARAGDPRAEAALARAIRRSPGFATKARTDGDLAAVRDTAWFRKLVR